MPAEISTGSWCGGHISDDIGHILDRLQIEADADIGVGHDAVEQPRLEMPFERRGPAATGSASHAARDLAVEGVDAETEIAIRYAAATIAG